MLYPNNSNYHTIFKCSFIHQNKSHKLNLAYYACFSQITNHIDYVETVKEFNLSVYLNTSKKYSFSQNINNYVLLTEKEIHCWLEEIQKIIPFNYTLKKLKEFNEIPQSGGFLGYELNITIPEVTRTEILFMATCIRALYECPMSYALLDAINFKNKNFDRYELDLFTIFKICIAVSKSTGNHSIFNSESNYLPRVQTIKQLQRELKIQKSLHKCFPMKLMINFPTIDCSDYKYYSKQGFRESYYKRLYTYNAVIKDNF